MTIVSDHPSLWPLIDFYQLYSYVTVASSTALMYNWVLTFGQEIELRQRWSIMTVLYLSVRYTGILLSIAIMLVCLPSVRVTSVGCNIMVFVLVWTSFIVNTMLSAIVIARLHAMYQQSRRILIFLLVIFLALTITCGVIAIRQSQNLYGDESIISGTYQCIYRRNDQLSTAGTWIFGTVWEVLALCLAVWVAVKHFYEMQGQVLRTGDIFRVLIQTHVFYFASYAVVSCFSLGLLSRKISDSSSLGVQIYYCVFQIAMSMQMFVLGPRLIISVREYCAKAVTNADAGAGMSEMSFQERACISSV